MMRVNFYATLRNIVGAKTAEFELPEGATLADLLDEMLRRYPGLRPELLNEQGEMYAHVHMFLNGRDAPFLERGMDTRLAQDDVVGVFPAVGGG
jgi:molybdopterin synthase sulfur carrier subunit